MYIYVEYSVHLIDIHFAAKFLHTHIANCNSIIKMGMQKKVYSEYVIVKIIIFPRLNIFLILFFSFNFYSAPAQFKRRY